MNPFVNNYTLLLDFSKSVEEKLSFTDKSTKFRVNVIIMFYYEIRKVV